mgnify:CR=1 FL=1
MAAQVDFKTAGSESTFASAITLNVDFGTAAGRALLARVFTYGDAGGNGGVAILSVVVDPGGVNLTLTGDAVITSTVNNYYYQTGKVQDFAIVSDTLPTGVKQVVITAADGNSRIQAWVLTRNGEASVSTPVKTWGLSAAPSATISSASGATVVAFATAPIVTDGYTVDPNSPGVRAARVLAADAFALRGALWTEAGSATVTIDGTIRNAGTLAAAEWGVVAWSLTPQAQAGTAPAITVQAANASVTAGQTATFTVSATGTALTYQWQRNPGGAGSWSNISGATSASYTTAATTVTGGAANNGDTYRPVITGDTSPAATGTAATLTVSASAVAPTVTTHPSSQIATSGEVVTFSAGFAGTAPIAYQWRRNGAAISGATSTTYGRVAAVLDNGAQFDCVATNAAGSVTTAAATLTVNSVTLFGFDFHTLAGCRVVSFAGSGASLNTEVGTQVVVVAQDTATDAVVATSPVLTADSNSRLPRWTHAGLAGPGVVYDLKVKPQDGRKPYMIQLATS